MSETEFHLLKKEQSLLVDFSTFPANLVELLDSCIDATSSQQTHDMHTPRFVAVMNLLNNPSSVFSILETNPFKYLKHIELKFRPASDQTLKQHLADSLTRSKAQCAGLTRSLAETKERLAGTEKSLSQTQDRMREITSMSEAQLQDLRNAFGEQMNTQKAQAMAVQDSIKEVL